MDPNDFIRMKLAMLQQEPRGQYAERGFLTPRASAEPMADAYDEYGNPLNEAVVDYLEEEMGGDIQQANRNLRLPIRRR